MEDKTAPRYIRGKYSEGQKVATAKYNAKAYDRLEMKVPKGEKESIVTHAEKHDGSLNKFLNRAVSETISRDKDGDVNE
jgi:predicted HicB family RNase H-like nuclease